MKKLPILLLTAFILLEILSTDSYAIVAWARKHGMECNVCHIAGFKLTKTGQDFLRRGHQFPAASEKDANISDYLSLTEKIRVYTQSTETKESGLDDVNTSKSSIEAHNFTIYTGGPLDKGFSYFVEMYFQENSGKTSGASDFSDFGRSKLADAYLQYTLAQEEEIYTTARAGQIVPSLLHLHGVGGRLAQSRPLPFTSKVGDNPYQVRARQYGVAVAQKYTDFFGEIAVVNGTGDEPFNRVDNDVHKDFWATLDYSYGEYGTMIGLYFYDGKYPFTKVAAAEGFTPYDEDDEFTQIGLVGNYTIEQGALLGGYIQGKNKYQKTGSSNVDRKSRGYFAEAQLYISGDVLTPFLRYEFFDSDTDQDDNERNNVILGLNWKPFRHGRFVFEANHDVAETSSDKEAVTDKLLLEMQWMF